MTTALVVISIWLIVAWCVYWPLTYFRQKETITRYLLLAWEQECYLRSLDSQNPVWMGDLSSEILNTRRDMTRLWESESH